MGIEALKSEKLKDYNRKEVSKQDSQASSFPSIVNDHIKAWIIRYRMKSIEKDVSPLGKTIPKNR